MIYQVEQFTVDTVNFEIKSSKGSIACEPKVFDLIIYLIANHHRLVSRDEIFKEIWQGRDVSDTTLSNHIKLARKVFGDDGQAQKIIKTVHGRGYQFVAPFKECDAPLNLLGKKTIFSKKAFWISLIVVLSIFSLHFLFFNLNQESRDKTYLIGVLPLVNANLDTDTDYLGFAIADRIISELAYQNHINVRSSSSIRKYSNTITEPAVVGEELNVDYLLTGNYLSIDNQIRLSFELIDVKNKQLIWHSSQIEVAFSNAFQLQDIVAKEVIEGLQVKLSPQKNVNQKQSINPLAYEYYLKSIAQPYDTEGHEQAIDLLKKSLEIDDNYAPAYVQLGNRIRRLEQFGLVNTGESHDTLNYYERALSIDSNLLSALSHLAFVYTETNRINEAMELAIRMVKINPNNAQTRFTLGYILRYAGHTKQAILEMEKAVELDPKNVRFRTLVSTYSGMAMFQESFAQLKRYSDSPFKTGWNGLLNLRLGNRDVAIENFDKLIQSDSNGLWGLVAKIHKSFLIDELNTGLIATHQLEQTNTVDSETVYYIAVYYCMLGDEARCLNSYEKSVEGGYYNYHYIDNSPYWDGVKNTPEFNVIYNKSKRKSEAFGRKYFSAQNASLFTCTAASEVC